MMIPADSLCQVVTVWYFCLRVTCLWL